MTDAAALQLLSTRKRPGFWGATRDSGQDLVALLQYAALKNAAPDASKAQTLALWQGDRKILESVTDSKSSWDGHTLVLSGAELVAVGRTEETGEETTPPLRLVYAGEDAVNVHAHLSVVRQPTLIGENRGDLFIKWHYMKAASSGEASSLRPGDPVMIGDVVDVVLSLGANRRIDHLSLTDFMPAGFELACDLPIGWASQDGQLDARLQTLEAETVFRYSMKATRPGQFHALPARLNAIYLARLDASSEEMVFFVK